MKLKKAIEDLKKGKYKYSDLESMWGLNRKKVRNLIYDIQQEGYTIKKERAPDGKTMFYIPQIEIGSDEYLFDGPLYTRFGIISDKHIGSKYSNKKLLRNLYHIMKEEGANFIIDAGDLTDGFNVYRGQLNEIEVFGFDDAVNLVSDVHPDDLKTYFVEGNHDISWYKNVGADIGKAIHRVRPDIIPIGKIGARIKGKDGAEIEVVHPNKGIAYANSYHGQKQVEQMVDKPDLIIRGHHHIALYMKYLGTHVIEAGTTQKQTPFMKSKSLYPDLGGWIVELYNDKIKLEWLE